MAPSEPRLLGPPVSAAPVPGSVLCTCDFSSGDPLCPLWPPGAAILALSWFETRFSLRLHCVVLWLASLYVRSSCYVERSIGGGALIDGKVAYCFAFGCAHEVASIGSGCDACTSTPGCLPCQGEGIRTGGRLHPGLAGERLRNNAHRWTVWVWLLGLRARDGLWCRVRVRTRLDLPRVR